MNHRCFIIAVRLLIPMLLLLVQPVWGATAEEKNTKKRDGIAFAGKARGDMFRLLPRPLPGGPAILPEIKEPEVKKAEPVSPEPVTAPPAASTDPQFHVEAIIAMGERGCATVDGKLWYLGDLRQGYVLQSLTGDQITLATPDGRTIVRTLQRRASTPTERKGSR